MKDKKHLTQSQLVIGILISDPVEEQFALGSNNATFTWGYFA